MPVLTSTASLAPAFLNRKSVKNFFAALLTFFLVNVTWVFFRAQDFPTAGKLLGSMFGVIDGGAPILSTLAIIKVSVITILLVASHWMMRNTGVLQVAQKTSWVLISIVWTAMIILLILSQESSNSFIYFQF
jgi:hypothetical protein